MSLSPACWLPGVLFLLGCEVVDRGEPRPAIRPDVTFTFEFEPPDAELAAELRASLAVARQRIEEFFSARFREDVRIRVFSSRSEFSASFPPEWGMGETQCWMVAAGVAEQLRLLSPRVWDEEACEHDATDARHVEGIVTHELVHVFHGQHNPTRDFTGAEEIGWFAEGLAVHVSGQLEHGRLAEPREAVMAGLAPQRLAAAWSGKYRYGVCGSLVAYVDETFGREVLVDLLAVTRQEDLLERLGISEQELLAEWEGFVLSAAPGPEPE